MDNNNDDHQNLMDLTEDELDALAENDEDFSAITMHYSLLLTNNPSRSVMAAGMWPAGMNERRLKYLCQALARNSVVAFLIVPQLQRGCDITALGQAMSRNVSINVLSVTESYRITGMNALWNALRTNTTLESLELATNRLDDVDIVQLASALAENRSIKNLNLAGNEHISDIGALALAGMLRHNSTLQDMDIPGNKISIDGVTALCSAMEVNLNVTRLTMVSEYSDDASAIALGKSEASMRIQELCRLNKYGRKLLRSETVPHGFWAHILARNPTPSPFQTTPVTYQPSMLFYFLQNKASDLIVS